MFITLKCGRRIMLSAIVDYGKIGNKYERKKGEESYNSCIGIRDSSIVVEETPEEIDKLIKLNSPINVWVKKSNL